MKDESKRGRRLALTGALAIAALASCADHQRPFHPPQIDLGARQINYQHDVQLFEVPSNGLLVAVAPEPNTNLVKVDVRYRVGSADDPPGKPGLAHLVEHMLFLLRDQPDGPTLTDRLTRDALTYNAYTSWDETQFTSAALVGQLRGLLAAEKTRMAARCDQLDQESFDRERHVVEQELLQRSNYDDDTDRITAALFGADHPYGRRISGTTASLEALTLDDVCGFIDHYYAPDRAILVVSGAFYPADARRMVGELFGPLARRKGYERSPVPAFDPESQPIRISLGVREATAFIAVQSPGWGSRDRLAQEVAATLLRSRLARAADDKRFITDTGVVEIGGHRRGALVVAMSVAEPGDLDRAVKFFYHDVLPKAFVTDDITLEVTKATLQSGLFQELEPFPRRASRLADYLQYRHDHWLMVGEMNDLDSVKAADLEATGEEFARERCRVVYVLPDPDHAAHRQRVTATATRRDYDISSWQQPVDPAQAEQPLSSHPRPGHADRREFTLDNGFSVVLLPGFSHPVIEVRVVFPAGYANDPEKLPGLSEWAADLLDHDYSPMFRKDIYRRKITQVLRMGGLESASVGERSTSFRIYGLSAFADGLIWELNWLLESGIYPKTSLLHKWMRELAEREQARGDDREQATDRATRAVLEALYGPDHPYAHVSRGLALPDLDRNDLEWFRDRYYRARGATIIVAGQFDADAVEAQLRRLYGAWPAAKDELPAVEIPDAHPRGDADHLALVDDSAVQARVLIAFPTAAGFRGKEAARRVLREILDRRMSAVREQLAASYGVTVKHATREGPGVWIIDAALDPTAAGAALETMRNALDSLRRGDGLAADLVRARQKELERAMAARADSSSTAAEVEFIRTYHLPATYFDDVAAEIARLTPKQLAEVIAEELAPEHEVTLVTGAADQIRAIYRGAGIDKYQTVE